jgi:hypothetical protein
MKSTSVPILAFQPLRTARTVQVGLADISQFRPRRARDDAEQAKDVRNLLLSLRKRHGVLVDWDPQHRQLTAPRREWTNSLAEPSYASLINSHISSLSFPRPAYKTVWTSATDVRQNPGDGGLDGLAE